MSVTKKDIGSWVQWRLFAVAVIISLWWFVWRESSVNKIVQSPPPTVQVAGGSNGGTSQVEVPKGETNSGPSPARAGSPKIIDDPMTPFWVESGETVRFKKTRGPSILTAPPDGNCEIIYESIPNGFWVNLTNKEVGRKLQVYVSKTP